MTMVIVGKADRNRTIEEVMGASARTGARYLDLASGNLIAVVLEAPKESTPVDIETGETKPVKKKKK